MVQMKYRKPQAYLSLPPPPPFRPQPVNKSRTIVKPRKKNVVYFCDDSALSALLVTRHIIFHSI